VAGKRTPDGALLNALARAYAARARLFHNGIVASRIDLLIAEIDSIPDSGLRWNLSAFGITSAALERVKESGALPHQVFAHPALIVERPHLIAYYRNIATVSRKGIGQILFPTESYETRRRKMSLPDAKRLCRTLNSIIAGVIDAVPDYTVALSRKAIFAEIGAQIQGAWANVVGQGASKEVADLLEKYVQTHGLGRRVSARRFELKEGWTAVFGSEPDVAFLDAAGVVQVAPSRSRAAWTWLAHRRATARRRSRSPSRLRPTRVATPSTLLRASRMR